MAGHAPAQLPLALVHPPQYGRESFLSASCNRAALALIERWPAWPAPVVVLSGPAGSGKTHLMHIWAERSGAAFEEAEALSGADSIPPFAGGALVIDNVNPGNVPEAALFHQINDAMENGGALLIASRLPAAEWRIRVSDLRSRLRLATPAALETPDDDLLRQVLVKLFADRQLVVDRLVLDYLAVRMERSLAAAARLVEALDRESLARGTAITRPLAARIFVEMAESEAKFADRK